MLGDFWSLSCSISKKHKFQVPQKVDSIEFYTEEVLGVWIFFGLDVFVWCRVSMEVIVFR